MSGRPGIVASAYVPADGGESPNAFKPFVSAEIRCHWPPLATDEQIRQAIDDAMHDALRQISAKRGKRIAELAHDDFDRWLAEHNRKVRAEAWDEGYEDRRADEHEHRPGRKYANPYKEQP